MKPTLFTIGYCGFSIREFARTLRENGINTLVDVREIPLSRKVGFSKTALRAALGRYGIAYRHFRPLGSPRDFRHEVRETRDYRKFFSRVRKHLAKVEPQDCLKEVESLAAQTTVCLMCCCSDWEKCHRSCVVDALSRLGRFEFVHLIAPSLQLSA